MISALLVSKYRNFPNVNKTTGYYYINPYDNSYVKGLS